MKIRYPVALFFLWCFVVVFDSLMSFEEREWEILCEFVWEGETDDIIHLEFNCGDGFCLVVKWKYLVTLSIYIYIGKSFSILKSDDDRECGHTTRSAPRTSSRKDWLLTNLAKWSIEYTYIFVYICVHNYVVVKVSSWSRLGCISMDRVSNSEWKWSNREFIRWREEWLILRGGH